MKKFTSILVTVLMVAVYVSALTLGDVLDKTTAETKGFSCKMLMVSTTKDAKTMTVNGTLYVKKSLTRMDTLLSAASLPDPASYQQVKMMGLDEQQVIIKTVGEDYVVDIVFPKNEAYVESTIKKNSAEASQIGAYDKTFERKIEKIGTAMYAGVNTDKYKAILDDTEKKSLTEMVIYIDPVKKMYIGQEAKTITGDTVKIEFSSFVFGIGDDVFVTPPAYTKYGSQQEMYMDLMKDFQGN